MRKCFDICIYPRKLSSTIDVLWSPPPCGWIKCNIDRVASGSPMLTAYGGLFRDENVNQLINFSTFLDFETPVFAEFLAAIIAIEKAKELNWLKLWLETDCTLVVKDFSNLQWCSEKSSLVGLPIGRILLALIS